MNTLYYGDNLKILQDRNYFPDACVDLVYLDPPFNSNRNYNVLFENESGKVGRTIRRFRQFIGTKQMMAHMAMMVVRLKERSSLQHVSALSFIVLLGLTMMGCDKYEGKRAVEGVFTPNKCVKLDGQSPGSFGMTPVEATICSPVRVTEIGVISSVVVMASPEVARLTLPGEDVYIATQRLRQSGKLEYRDRESTFDDWSRNNPGALKIIIIVLILLVVVVGVVLVARHVDGEEERRVRRILAKVDANNPVWTFQSEDHPNPGSYSIFRWNASTNVQTEDGALSVRLEEEFKEFSDERTFRIAKVRATINGIGLLKTGEYSDNARERRILFFVSSRIAAVAGPGTIHPLTKINELWAQRSARKRHEDQIRRKYT